MLDNYRSIRFSIPLWRKPYPGRDPFDVVDVHRKYPINSSPQVETFEFRDFEKVVRNATDGVCRVWTGPRGDERSLSFIIKFAIAGADERHKSLEREAVIYHEHLSSLQGIDIPLFFGLFGGEDLRGISEKPTRVTCIVLEDCGDEVERFFTDLPLADRAEILKKIGRIHKCGVTLDDFAERNVVQKDGSYRIIDFQHVDTGHLCRWSSGLVYEGDIIPRMDDIGCPEMHDLGLELDLWRQRNSVSIFGKNLPKRDFPSQDAVNALLQGLPAFHFDNEQRLHNWIKYYKKFQDRMSPEQYMEKYKRPDFTRPPRELGRNEYV